MTVNVNFTDPVTGFAPPVVAFTTMFEVPVGVPGSLGVLLELPPHEDIQSAEKLSKMISASIRIAPSERLREPMVTNTPSNPGNKKA